MDLLDEDVFFFSTFGGEVLSLAAAQAVLDEMQAHNVPAYLARQGEKLQSGYNAIARTLGISDYTRCNGHPSRTIVVFDSWVGDPLLMKSLVQQELIKRGILWSGFHNVSLSHGDPDVDYTLAAYAEVLSILKQAVDARVLEEVLRGEPVQPVFRKTAGFNSKPRAGRAVLAGEGR
jgi:glutamate-1-semialdehyde aminotransferase